MSRTQSEESMCCLDTACMYIARSSLHGGIGVCLVPRDLSSSISSGTGLFVKRARDQVLDSQVASTSSKCKVVEAVL